MLRILHITPSMDRGGIETLLMNLYRNIDRNKIQFDFLLSSDKEDSYNEEIRELGGKIYHIPSRRKGIFKNRTALDSFFKTHNYYDIIHQHVSSLSYIVPLKFAKKYGIKHRVVHIHNTMGPKGFLHAVLHRFNRVVINKYCTDKFACSIDAAIWGFGSKELKNKSFHVLNNGVETDHFIYNETIRKKIRTDLNLEKKFVVGHVGRFSKQKNHEFIIKVFAELKKIRSDSLLLLVGTGKLEPIIREQVKELKLDNDIMFLGLRSDVNILMQAMDVFLFPSLYEGLGIAAVEAQASGLPVYASNEVPKEAAVTGLFHTLNLKWQPIEWAKYLESNSHQEFRVNTKALIVEQGYDITTNVEWITRFYSNLN
jgi:glycosyltransferase involved in cell wall biosynthesis